MEGLRGSGRRGCGMKGVLCGAVPRAPEGGWAAALR